SGRAAATFLPSGEKVMLADVDQLDLGSRPRSLPVATSQTPSPPSNNPAASDLPSGDRPTQAPCVPSITRSRLPAVTSQTEVPPIPSARASSLPSALRALLAMTVCGSCQARSFLPLYASQTVSCPGESIRVVTVRPSAEKIIDET